MLLKKLRGKYTTAKFLLQYNYYKAQTLFKNLFINEATRECNVCGWHGKSFYAFYNEMSRKKDQTLCPKCESSVYQRALAKYLKENCEINHHYSVLEIAPHSSDPVGKTLSNMNYISIDIVKGRAMMQMDLCDLKYKDSSFDLVICSAVLEHIKDDKKAMLEIYRTLKPQGRAIIEIPMGYYDDINATRTVEFKKQPFYEHWRSYGFDNFFNLAFQIGLKMDNIRCFNYRDKKLGLGESPSLMGFFEVIK